VATVILRAAKEGKVEYYIPYSERILSSFALLFPVLIPTVKRQKAYLASRAKDTLPEGTPILERERAEPCKHGSPRQSPLTQLFVSAPISAPAGSSIR
jgi:hypothetical protein